MNDMTPAAYLLHGGRLSRDRASTHLNHAEKDQKDRNDGSKIEPLFRQSEVEFADSERQSQIRGLEIALCGYADEVDQLTARNAELEAEVARLREAIEKIEIAAHQGGTEVVRDIARNALKESGL